MPDASTFSRPPRVRPPLVHLLVFVVLTLAALRPVPAWAQDADTSRVREVQLRADSLISATLGGEAVRQLVGRVQLVQDSTVLQARRATEYLARREILFVGEVVIMDQGDTLRADEVLYDRDRKVGEATGRVRLTDGEVLVLAPAGRYFADEKRSVFTDGVTLVDSATTVVSAAATYFSDDARAELVGDVRLTDDRTYLEADSVTYLRDEEVSRARGDVFIERFGDPDDAAADTTGRTLLFGQRAYHDARADVSRLTGDPLLVQLQADSSGAPADTLLIRAAVLEASRVDSLQRLVAVDAVRIWQRDLAAVADSVVYERVGEAGERRQESRLFGGPMAWFEANQVSGDTLRVVGRGQGVDTLFVRENAFVAQQDTVLGRLQQLQGRHLVGRFRDDSLRTLTVGPNAEAIYYLRDDDEAAAGGVEASADRIVFHFAGGELVRTSVLDGVEGTYYPEAALPDPFRLSRFVWAPERRPEKAALLSAPYVRARLEGALPPAAPPEADVRGLPVPADTSGTPPG